MKLKYDLRNDASEKIDTISTDAQSAATLHAFISALKWQMDGRAILIMVRTESVIF